jgi:Rad5p-binding protein
MSVDSSGMEPPPLPSDGPEEPKHGGHTRFELELEVSIVTVSSSNILTNTDCPQFVQALSNPEYVNWLASRKYLMNPAFVAYLDYLQYWSRPPYLKYLTYPTATLRMLQLLQSERFRQEILVPDVAWQLRLEGMKAAVLWHKEG